MYFSYFLSIPILGLLILAGHILLPDWRIEAVIGLGAVAYIPDGQPEAAYFDQSWPIIRMLVVDPAERGKGLGHALTSECLARARRDFPVSSIAGVQRNSRLRKRRPPP